MRDDRVRLEDIVEAAEAIEKYAARGRPAFEQDELIQSWIVHHLQNIGEAARGLSAAFRERDPEFSPNSEKLVRTYGSPRLAGPFPGRPSGFSWTRSA